MVKAAAGFGQRTAVIGADGVQQTRCVLDCCTCLPTSTNNSLPRSYKELLDASQRLAWAIRGEGQTRVAIMAGPGRHYVEATWAAWLARGIAVPLCLAHPPACVTSCMRAPCVAVPRD